MYVHYFQAGPDGRTITVISVGRVGYDAYAFGFRIINFTRSDCCWMVPGTVDPMED